MDKQNNFNKSSEFTDNPIDDRIILLAESIVSRAFNDWAGNAGIGELRANEVMNNPEAILNGKEQRLVARAGEEALGIANAEVSRGKNA